MSIKDLSPKLKVLPSAEQELMLPFGELPIGQRSGGVAMFSDVFKRGYGNAVFGSDSNGIWLGAADFEDAPFKVNMLGNLISSLLTIKNSDDETIIDPTGLVSTTNFSSNHIASGSHREYDGDDTWQDIEDGDITIPALSRSTNVLIIYNINYALADMSDLDVNLGGLDLWIDNVQQSDAFFNQLLDTNISPSVLQTRPFTFVGTGIKQLSAGAHTLQLKCRANGPTNVINRSDLIYIILGK